MGMRIGDTVHVDLDDLKRASGQIDDLAYPTWSNSMEYVRDRVTFHTYEEPTVRCCPDVPSDINEVLMGRFDLTRHTVYECVSKNVVKTYDVWKHNDVIVRKIETGTRYRDKYGMWHG